MTLYNITHEGFNTLQENLKLAKENSEFSRFVNSRPETFLEDEILHVWVFGGLLRNPAPILKELGNTAYEDIAKDLQIECKGIIIHVDSPGGSVAGNIEVAELISSLSVPVVAYCEGLACSAAYKLTAGADYIVATPSAVVGNIGTIMAHTDTSRLYEGAGISVQAFTNDGADLKSTGHLPSLSDEQKQFLQASINEAGEIFKNHVLANRDVNEEVFRAGWYSGTTALALGLIDEIGSLSLAKERILELVELTQSL